MKNNKLIYIAFFSLIITTFFVSCSKDEDNIPQEESPMLFSKEIKVFDLNNECSAVMNISAEDASLLDFYTEENFEIIPVKEGQTFDEAVDAYYALYPIHEVEDLTAEENDDESIIEDSDAPTVNIEKVSEKLVEGVKYLAITSIAPDFGDARGWNISTYWDFVPHRYVDIKRTSALHKTYYGLHLESLTYNWLVPYPKWMKNNKTYSHEIPDGNDFWNFKVKYRKTKHFTYSFHD